MHTTSIHTKANGNLSQLSATTKSYYLSPITRYSLSKLLRQIANGELPEFLKLKNSLSIERCDFLNEILQQRFSNDLELAQVIPQLENLVYLYTTLSTGASRYIDLTTQQTQVVQEILQLLGFTESVGQ